jgi:hypothetical protein
MYWEPKPSLLYTTPKHQLKTVNTESFFFLVKEIDSNLSLVTLNFACGVT